MDYGLWIAVLGAATGVVGLLLHLRRFLEEQPRLVVQFSETNRGQVVAGYLLDHSRPNAFGEPHLDKSRFIMFMWVRLLNRSDKPATLFEVTLSMPQHPTYVFDSGFSGPTWARTEDSSRSFHKEMLPLCKDS